ncbi:MAG: ribonuclease HIII [Clostridia bacterium]
MKPDAKLVSIGETMKVTARDIPRVREVVEAWPGDIDRKDDAHCVYSYRLSGGDERLTVRQYTNGTLQIQGKAGERAKAFLERLRLAVVRDGDGGLPLPHCGSDEAGKGDYFGPLVVAAIAVDEGTLTRLVSIGVSDSKRLSDARSLDLAKKISAITDSYAIISLKPIVYNDLYARLRAEGKNLNDLLAWAHSKVIGDLEDKFDGRFGPTLAVVDKFAREGVLGGRMKKSSLKLMQVARAERYPAVASASILARARFLRELKALSAKAGITFPKGAGSAVDAAARELVNRLGSNALGEVAKIHFSNTKRILGGDCDERR